MIIGEIITGGISLIPNPGNTTAATIETTNNDVYKNLTSDTYSPFSKENISKHTENGEKGDDLFENIEIPMNPTRKTLLEVKDIDGLNSFLKNLSKSEYNKFLDEYTQSQGDYAFSLKSRKKLTKERGKMKNKLNKEQQKYADLFQKFIKDKDNKHLEKKVSKEKKELKELREKYKNKQKELTKINQHLMNLQKDGNISYSSYIKKILFGLGKQIQRTRMNNMIRYVNVYKIIYITPQGVSERSVRQNY